LPAGNHPAPGDTIVVLSAGLHVDDEEGQRVRLDEASMQRCLTGRRLYRDAGRCAVLLTGGKVDWDTPGPTFAAAMRDFMLQLGVRADDIVMEEKASTTYENALFSAPLLNRTGKGRIWLVTNASHMNRAERCFRKAGIDVVPVPCDYSERGFEFESTTLLPSSHTAAHVSRAAHEWLGRAWYRLRGRI
jgi:uncharacterized SAM-binding protein YcdF (DUF218 family)